MKNWKQLKETVLNCSNYGEKGQNIALDARKLNKSCVKKSPYMPNMEELLNQTSAELSKNDHDPIWISVIDFDYAYGQMKLAPETSKHCNFAITGKKINGNNRFPKGFYGPADIPTIFQKKIVRTLGHQIPGGYRTSKKKSKFYQKETIWHTQYHKMAPDQTKKKQMR